MLIVQLVNFSIAFLASPAGKPPIFLATFLVRHLRSHIKIMRTMELGVSPLKSSRLAYGCWRVAGSWNPEEVTPESRAAGRRAILAAYEAGYTLFDNADIYCGGEAERVFGTVLKEVSGMRVRQRMRSPAGSFPTSL